MAVRFLTDQDLDSLGGGGGGGTAETWAETQLAKGVLAAETPANTISATGVTIGDLREYKRFIIVVDGESNTNLGNLMFQFNGVATFQNTIYRSDSAGGKAMYEWLDNERTLLRLVAFYGGNPSTITFGGNIIQSAYVNFGTGSILGGGATEIVGTSSLADSTGLYISNASKPSIAYNWEVRGLTK